MSNIASLLSEVYRVLTPKGVFISVSYGTPENRELYLKKVCRDFSPLNFYRKNSIGLLVM